MKAYKFPKIHMMHSLVSESRLVFFEGEPKGEIPTSGSAYLYEKQLSEREAEDTKLDQIEYGGSYLYGHRLVEAQKNIEKHYKEAERNYLEEGERLQFMESNAFQRWIAGAHAIEACRRNVNGNAKRMGELYADKLQIVALKKELLLRISEKIDRVDVDLLNRIQEQTTRKGYSY